MNNKSLYIQKIRAILIIMVIFIHSISESNNIINNYIIVSMRTACNIAVPCFFFISGYFFNVKKMNENKFKYLKDKIFRLLIPLLIWNIFYFIVSRKYVFSNFIFFKTESHLYYVIVLIQLFLLTPIIIKYWNNNIFKIFCYLLTPIYLIIYRYLWIKYDYMIPFHSYYFFAWIFYYIEGIRIRKKVNIGDIHYKKTNIIPIIICYILCIIYNIVIYRYIGIRYALSQMNDVNLIFFIVIILCGWRSLIKNDEKNNFMVKIGDNSFGIYLLHLFVLKIVSKVFSTFIFNDIILIFVKAIFTIILSEVIIEIIKNKIPSKYCKIIGF